MNNTVFTRDNGKLIVKKKSDSTHWRGFTFYVLIDYKKRYVCRSVERLKYVLDNYEFTKEVKD